MLEILQVERDDFWSWHWTWRSPRLKKPQPLLGAARVTDLAVNVILPWLWARAAEGKNTTLQLEIERRYFGWPAAEDNSVLKLARQRLLGTASRGALRSAAAQQGLLQIVRDFCAHSNAICENCRLPAMAGEFRAGKKPSQVNKVIFVAFPAILALESLLETTCTVENGIGPRAPVPVSEGVCREPRPES